DLKQYPGGPPRVPYDVTAWTLPMQMGVEVIEVIEPLTIESKPIERASVLGGVSTSTGRYFLIERRYTNSYGLVYELLKKSIPVLEARQSAVLTQGSLPAGSFLIAADKIERSQLDQLARQWQVSVRTIENLPVLMTRELTRPRIGIYQPWITSMDEGWTRLLLDQLGIEYRALHNEDFLRKGVNLRDSFDIIIFPDLSSNQIIKGKEVPEGKKDDDDKEEPILGTPQLPKEYQGGIGKEGVEAIKEFVKAGGTLLALGGATDFAIEKLRLPVINDLKGVSSKDFYAPGSILEVEIDAREPLAFGMPKRAHIYFINNPAFRLLPYTQESRVIAFYGETTPLRSGSLLGAERLLSRIAMAEIPVEKGRVILYGFRVQHRAQTYGTFKLLLNSLFK
ncbi:MAG: hypothetical protein AB1489_28170, partial [Acidobacteriota bacterium]